MTTSTAPTQPALTAWDHAKFVGVCFRAVAALFGSLLTAGFRGESGAPTFKRHVLYSTFRTFSRSNSTKQMQASSGTSIGAYEEFMKKNSLKSEVVDLPDNTQGAWLGDKYEGTVILWLHGGGYAGCLTPGHLQLVHDIIEVGKPKNVKLSCFFLQYDLSPQAVYPRQLIQATAALRYLVDTAGVAPSHIIVAGDSAGGNLSLGLLSHIKHPHPSVTSLNLSEDLKGVILLSPWVTFDQTAPAMKSNANKDMLDLPVLKRWSDAFMGGARPDQYNHPLMADGSWWKDMPAKEIYVLAGKDEVFISDIEEFVEKLKVCNESKTTLLVAHGEAHDMPIIDYLLGFPKGTQTKALQEWVLDRA